MDLLQLHAKFGIDIPAERGAQDTRAEIITSIIGVADHDSKILRNVMKKYV